MTSVKKSARVKSGFKLDATFFWGATSQVVVKKSQRKGINIYVPTTEGRKYGPTTEGRKNGPTTGGRKSRKGQPQNSSKLWKVARRDFLCNRRWFAFALVLLGQSQLQSPNYSLMQTSSTVVGTRVPSTCTKRKTCCEMRPFFLILTQDVCA